MVMVVLIILMMMMLVVMMVVTLMMVMMTIMMVMMMMMMMMVAHVVCVSVQSWTAKWWKVQVQYTRVYFHCATVFCWHLQPTLNKFYLILSYPRSVSCNFKRKLSWHIDFAYCKSSKNIPTSLFVKVTWSYLVEVKDVSLSSCNSLMVCHLVYLFATLFLVLRCTVVLFQGKNTINYFFFIQPAHGKITANFR